MKNRIFIVAFFFILNIFLFPVYAETCPSFPIYSGFYLGLGGSWNTINESFYSTFFSSSGKGAIDNYKTSFSRLAPLAEIGYWRPLCGSWLWGVTGQWKHLNFQTPNEDSSRGQHLPNASFSSKNFFGPDIVRDFNTQTTIRNEYSSLLYLGFQIQRGFLYLGIGPAALTTSNSVYLSSVHVPNGTGDVLIATSVSHHKTIWGEAAQVGYNYYIRPTCFISLAYSYTQTGRNNFNNTANAAIFNGFDFPGSVNLSLNRQVKFSNQEAIISINKIF